MSALSERLDAAIALAGRGRGRALGRLAELHINLWDCAAALALLQEAEAVCSLFLPRGVTSGAPILAIAPGIADALRTASALF